MRRVKAAAAIGTVATALLVLGLAPASGQYPPPQPPPSPPPPGSTAQSPPSPGPGPVEVTANGNAIYDQQHLNFAPASVTATVGRAVRWTNTDPIVPHTVTEDHALFDLAGTYGMTPLNPAGFAPGTSVQRIFEAGTFHYYCRVHPVPMHGVVAVPVTLARVTAATSAVRSKARKHRRKKHRRHHRKPVVAPPSPPQGAHIQATWASLPPVAGEVFDVQYRAGSGPWQTLAAGTTQLSATFAGGVRGTVWQVQARLRSATEPARASDWSPLASITS